MQPCITSPCSRTLLGLIAWPLSPASCPLLLLPHTRVHFTQMASKTILHSLLEQGALLRPSGLKPQSLTAATILKTVPTIAHQLTSAMILLAELTSLHSDWHCPTAQPENRIHAATGVCFVHGCMPRPARAPTRHWPSRKPVKQMN